MDAKIQNGRTGTRPPNLLSLQGYDKHIINILVSYIMWRQQSAALKYDKMLRTPTI